VCVLWNKPLTNLHFNTGWWHDEPVVCFPPIHFAFFVRTTLQHPHLLHKRSPEHSITANCAKMIRHNPISLQSKIFLQLFYNFSPVFFFFLYKSIFKYRGGYFSPKGPQKALILGGGLTMGMKTEVCSMKFEVVGCVGQVIEVTLMLTMESSSVSVCMQLDCHVDPSGWWLKDYTSVLLHYSHMFYSHSNACSNSN